MRYDPKANRISCLPSTSHCAEKSIFKLFLQIVKSSLVITPSGFAVAKKKRSERKILEILNFKYLLRLITHTSHLPRQSVDEIYWHFLFFLKVQKKRRIVARVQCRNIKNECPKPTCEEPILLPGRCCKTCPGDSHSKLANWRHLNKLRPEKSKKKVSNKFPAAPFAKKEGGGEGRTAFHSQSPEWRNAKT